MDIIKLTHNALSVEVATNEASDPSCGAISLFIGTTRDNFEGKEVAKLEYEAYEEMAKKEMKSICNEARKKYDLKHIVMHHRLGVVDIKEASVIIAVSSVHRRASLDAVSFLIDSLKATVPIWKKEVYDDGTTNWKENKECQWNKNSVKVETTSPFNDEPERSVDFDSRDVDASEESSFPSSEQIINKDLIQIHASREEIECRISAFQKRKREELDIMNINEFCFQGPEDESSCARTSAIIFRSKDSSSHLKFTKVKNHWGPLTESASQSHPITHENKAKAIKNEPRDEISSHPNAQIRVSHNDKPDGGIPWGIEERLRNMEGHLSIKPAGPVPQSVYKRIKDLEERILYLESLSPEYFREREPIPSSVPIKKKSLPVDDMKSVDDISLNDIDEQIFQLKKKLKKKQMGITKAQE